jgi:hypothetical protein
MKKKLFSGVGYSTVQCGEVGYSTPHKLLLKV